MSKRYFAPNAKEIQQLPLYIDTIGLNIQQEHRIRKDGFKDYQWIQCIEGTGIFLYKEKQYSLDCGQGMFIYPNDAHEYYKKTSSWKDCWISFNGEKIKVILEKLGFCKTELFNISNPQYLLSKLEKCYHICTSNKPISAIEASSALYSFLIDLAKNVSPFEKESFYKQQCKLTPVLNYINKNYKKPITLDELSNLINITPQYFCQIFKTIYKMRPFEYVNYIRIMKSKELLLKDKSLPIYKIAGLVGYDSQSYYSTQFKKIESISPGKFREIY